MGSPNIFIIFVLSQAVVISIIVVALKKILDRNLIDLAIQQLETGRLNPENSQSKNFDSASFNLVIVTHKRISDVDREHVLKALTKNIPGGLSTHFRVDPKILGGMILSVGPRKADYSLIDRLKRAR